MTAHTNPEGKRRALLDTPLLALCVLLLTACTSVIVPPEHVRDPVSVFVLDHGRHSSLVLPSDAGGAVRYSYGDWEYYALNQPGLGSGLRALLWPTPAALGQQLLAGQIDADSVVRQLRIGVLESFEVKVERAAVRQLQLELAGIFDGARETLHYSAAYDVHFVHHPEPYTINYNSNRMVGRWLQQLGCTITGRPVLSNWRIKR
ncbi:MAG TPA: hypothetical protein PK725_00885 [Rhodocyclaceae bacterium]|nr:hypothetical protein [Rhodocyclaceae bacterium]HRQ45468.1 hypothetical protein [Rhodocyclaceae bacterium]